MTRTLILMRHAKSSWDDPTLSDHDRPLNARGTASAVAMGRWLRENDHLPDAVVSSSSARTGQTFLGLGIDVAVTFTRALYHASPEMMMDVLREQTAPSLLMLGHNPGIADFAARLVARPPDHPRFVDYPTGATTVIRFDAPTWDALTWREGQAINFAIPREIMDRDS